MPVLFQPFAGSAVIGIYGLHGLPESGGVIHMRQMAQFMDYYIVQDGGWRKHKSPVEGKGSPGAAASPAGLLVPDSDAAVGSAGKLLEISRPLREVFSGGGDIPLGQGSTLGVSQI